MKIIIRVGTKLIPIIVITPAPTNTPTVGFLREVSKSEAFSNGLVTTDYLDNVSLEEFEEPRISDSILVSIAAGASRFGLDRNQLPSSSEILDEYSGHSGDPFKTLTRSYP